jgi:hypothetical protein
MVGTIDLRRFDRRHAIISLGGHYVIWITAPPNKLAGG